jgi:hypothetical protein
MISPQTSPHSLIALTYQVAMISNSSIMISLSLRQSNSAWTLDVFARAVSRTGVHHCRPAAQTRSPCCDPTSTTARLHFRLFLCRESLCNWQVDRWKGCGEFKEDEEIRECREEEGRQQPQRVERRLGR